MNIRDAICLGTFSDGDFWLKTTFFEGAELHQLATASMELA
jgi:hypothetical protein